MNYFKFVNIKKVTIHKNLDPVISSHHASEIGQITDLFFVAKLSQSNRMSHPYVSLKEHILERQSNNDSAAVT